MTRDTFNANWQAFKDAMQDPTIDTRGVTGVAWDFLEWYDGLATWNNADLNLIGDWILEQRKEAVR